VNEAILAGAIAGAVAGAIAGAAVLIASHGMPFGPFGRRGAQRTFAFHSLGSRATQPSPPPATPSDHRGSGGSPFGRFNDRAKRVLALAQDEAIRFNHNYIGTEHLLLGLVREGEGVAARALAAMGIELSKVRSAVEFIIGRGDSTTSPSEITLSPRTKKVIELAVDEARRMGHAHVGTEHLLLGLIREGEGIASGVIESLGVTLEAMRRKVLEVMGSPDSAPRPAQPAATQQTMPMADTRRSGPFDRFSDRSKRVLALAQDEAIRLKHTWIGTEHLMLGLIREGDSVAARALDSLGVQLSEARAAVEKVVPLGNSTTTPSEITLTPRTKSVIERAVAIGRERGVLETRPEILLLALVDDADGVGTQVLLQLGATPDKVREAVDRFSQPPPQPPSASPPAA
jgi:ATP-dependent Clp protease ATP-binding subunit ClpA